MQIVNRISVRTIGVFAAVFGYTSSVAHSAPELISCNDVEIEQVRSFLNDAEISLAEAIVNVEQQCKGRAIHAELIDENEHGTGASNGVRSRHYHVCCLASCEISYHYVDSRSGMVRATHEIALPPTDSRPESVEPVEQSTFLRASAGGSAPGTLAHPVRVQLASALIGMTVEDSPSQQTFRTRRASEMIGKLVENQRGEGLGEVQDLAIDGERGHVAYIVLSRGKAKSKGEKWFAIPTGALPLSEDGKHFILTVDNARLENAPGFDRKQWPMMGNSTWGAEVHTFYGLQPYWISEGDHSMSPELRMQKASDLIGRSVLDKHGETLGEIDDLVIDPDRYRIVYVVLTFGGIRSFSDKLFAIPAGILQMPGTGEYAELKVDKNRLKSAPAFDRNQWPNLADPTLSTRIYEFYGQQPYGPVNLRGEQALSIAEGKTCDQCGRTTVTGGYVQDDCDFCCAGCANKTGCTCNPAVGIARP